MMEVSCFGFSPSWAMKRLTAVCRNVERNVAEPSLQHRSLPGALEVVWVDRRTRLRREHEIALVGGLHQLVSAEFGNARGGQGHDPASSSALWVAESVLPKRLTNVEPPSVQLDVPPSKSEEFSSSQAGVDRDPEDELPLSLRCREHGLELLDGEDISLRSLALDRLDPCGGTDREVTPFERIVEHFPEHKERVADRRR